MLAEPADVSSATTATAMDMDTEPPDDTTDANWSAYINRETLYGRVLSQLAALPSFDVVVAKLGQEAAERFLQGCEHIEAMGHMDLMVDFDSRGTFTPQQCRAALLVVGLVADNDGDRELIVDAYEEHLRRVSCERRAQRERMRLANAPLRERALATAIWFPLSSEREQWSWVAGGEEMFALLPEVKKRMKKSCAGMLQYIRKRRLNSQSQCDAERNVAALRAYLLENQTAL